MKKKLYSLIFSILLIANASGEHIFINSGEIVVYGKGEYPGIAIIELNEEDIKKSGAQTVADILEYIPGCDIQTVKKGEAHISIRGFDQNKIKILIDGVPVYETYFGTVDLSAIPVEAIEKILVTRGATSVLYGANTMGGVVNIITKGGSIRSETKNEIEVSTLFGEYRTQGSFISQTLNTNKLNFFVSFNKKRSDGFFLSADFSQDDQYSGINSEYRENGGIRELSDFERSLLTTSLGMKINPSTRLNLSLTYLQNPRGCPVFDNRYWRFKKWEQWHIKLVLEKEFSDDIISRIRTFYIEHKDEIKDVASGIADAQSWFDSSYYDDFSTGLEIHTVVKLEKNNLIRFGLNFQKDFHEDKELNSKNRFGIIISTGLSEPKKYEADIVTLGLEDEVKLTKKLTLLLGTSYDIFSPVKSYNMPVPARIFTLNPQTSISYSIKESFAIFTSLGKKIRFPRLKELYSTRAGGNPDLKPEKTLFLEFGINYEIRKKGNLSLIYFQNNLHNLIAREKDNEGNWLYVNTTEVEMNGIEFTTRFPFSSKFKTGLNYTYLKTLNIENGRELSQKPRHKINLDLNVNFNSGFGLYLIGSYTGKQVLYNKDGSSRNIDDYSIFNLKIIQKLLYLKTIDAETFISIDNIFDTNYEEGTGPMPGRNIFAGVNFKF